MRRSRATTEFNMIRRLAALTAQLWAYVIVNTTRPGVIVRTSRRSIKRIAFITVQMAFTWFAISAPTLHAEEITVHHSQGETRVQVNPKVVATLDIASLDTCHFAA
jgi:hypothetical protein